MVRRERIVRTTPKRRRRPLEVLPLDPRDPDVVRAKALEASRRPPPRRAA
jgi:hypothetical protein